MSDAQAELKDLEARIEQRERQRADFAGTVSHDLKTPLNAIIGFTSVLLADAEMFGAEQGRQLKLVYDSARSLLDRINNLLEFYRLQAGKTGASLDWFYPAECVIQVIEQYRKQALSNGIKLEHELSLAPKRLRSDERLIRGIVDELVKNALQFGGVGDKLVMTVETMSSKEATQIRFKVTNPSSKMPAERLEKLKRTLASDDPESSYAFDGLGLGLALAREAANQLGGRLEFGQDSESRPEFSLVLDVNSDDFSVGET
jgi:signal transduction histidine kinase